MSKHTFKNWLCDEVTATRCALLTLYEQRDRLQYIEGPRLEKEYMDAVGDYENTVIKEEIECELLDLKRQIIQTAINRREPIDESAIDAEIDAERTKMLDDAANSAAPAEYVELTPEQGTELQKLYHDIVKNFHPQTHPEQTESHRKLFQKAQEAYRCNDLEALRLIYDMLCSTTDGGFEVTVELSNGAETDFNFVGQDYTLDYAAAAQIYDCFVSTSEEMSIREEWARCRLLTDDVMNEIERLRADFPYSASDMLADPNKIQAYKEDLAYRLRTAVQERERRTLEIKEMLKGGVKHE